MRSDISSRSSHYIRILSFLQSTSDYFIQFTIFGQEIFADPENKISLELLADPTAFLYDILYICYLYANERN